MRWRNCWRETDPRSQRTPTPCWFPIPEWTGSSRRLPPEAPHPRTGSGYVQVTVIVPAQVQPVPVAETRLAPAGIRSVTVTDAASDGPALDTFSVYVTGRPAQTGSGASACVMERSARPKTLEVSEGGVVAREGVAGGGGDGRGVDDRAAGEAGAVTAMKSGVGRGNPERRQGCRRPAPCPRRPSPCRWPTGRPCPEAVCRSPRSHWSVRGPRWRRSGCRSAWSPRPQAPARRSLRSRGLRA